MRVLVACEFSGIVRDAFRARGHHAWSIDLLPSERPGPHIQGDVLEQLRGYDENQLPDLLIAFPPCTYLTVAGARQFSHGEVKATCLWLKNLPKLEPTKIVEGRVPRVHHASPGPDRWKERSRTLQGIADAMAEQWGAL